jgi:peptidoglycan/LPS O-acetylase OafA/YrhL
LHRHARGGEPPRRRAFFLSAPRGAATAPGRFERPGLTGLRALAACWVAAHHFNALVGPRQMVLDAGFARLVLTPFLTIGWVGVDIFFVLSGFLLTIHFSELAAAGPLREAVPRYLRGRILRVVPAYWVQLALLVAVAWIAAGAVPAWIGYVPAHLVFLQNTTLASMSAINGVYWTLPVEFSFYLVLPFAAAWLLRGEPARASGRWGAILAGAIAIATLWRAFAQASFGDGPRSFLFFAATAQLPGALDEFAAGVAAAALFLRAGLPEAGASRGWARASDAMVAGGLALLLVLMYVMHARYLRYWAGSPMFYLWRPAASACIALAIAGVAIRGPFARALFENRVALFLGTVSYSLYLWHAPIANALAAHVDAHAAGVARFSAIAGPLSIAAATLSYVLVERPFLRLKRRAARRAADGGTLQ